MKKTIFILTILISAIRLVADPLPKVAPKEAGMDTNKLKMADLAIEQAIGNQMIPGAVLAVVRDGKMAYLKAYGRKQTFPAPAPMEVNTVFDMASCTKPLVTALSVMILVERGQLGLHDNVSKYLPGFTPWKNGETAKEIQLVHLLTHTSGLPSYAPETALIRRYGSPSPDGLMRYIDSCRRDFAPGRSMEYSCLNYITLQHIIEKVSGKSLRDFARENIFGVLGMTHSDFNPTGEILDLCAPTGKRPDGTVMKGIVHDPLARLLNGGISGNAGLFSDANDIGLLVAALLNGGEYNGKRILQPETVKLMTSLPDSLSSFGRTPGWDMASKYATCKGSLLSPHTYCHTGYTGTSVVVDPDNGLSIILLTNRVHPVDKGSVVKLRAQVADAVAEALNKSKLEL